MTNKISIEEWKLISFFEVEPNYSEFDEKWPYGDALFEIKRDDLKLSFAIHPCYKDIRIILKKDEIKFYELNAMNIFDIKYKKENSKEFLEIFLNNILSLTIIVKPNIEINEFIKNEDK
jgi:hypothetical protein